jgi:hypothetical protein
VPTSGTDPNNRARAGGGATCPACVLVGSWPCITSLRSDDARRVIVARGCQLLWLPPNPPDVSPSEQTRLSKFARPPYANCRPAQRGFFARP